MDRIADSSRFHAIYITGDIIPRMIRYLDPVYTEFAKCDMSEKFRKQNDPDKVNSRTGVH